MSSMNNHTIYFYATLGDMSKPAFGGGEVGNRRTLALFKQMGYNVVPIPKYALRNVDSLREFLNKFVDVVANLFNYVNTIRKGNRHNSIVHIAGFPGYMAYWTLILIYISKWLGYKTVYEIRGGGVVERYNSNGRHYRFCFNKAVRKADYVFSQGESNRPLIEKIKPDVDFYYYPNYVEEGFAPDEYPDKPKESVNLIYFGRLSHKKNIELIIDIFDEVSTQVEIPVTLSIIGNPESDQYFDLLQDKINKSPYSGSITLKTRCPHDVLKTILKDKLFYIFPTKENMEGHSNALTEAMTWGLVPIATSQGFNKDVIACSELIVDNLTKEAFSDIIIKIVEEKSFDRLSKLMYNRATNLYSCKSAYNRLCQKYSDLFKSL